MKNIFYLLLLLFSCRTGVNNFYQGRVLDGNDQPLEGVTVIEENGKGKQVRTDKSGYFKLDRSPDWLGRLIFMKQGYRTDTIPSVWRQSGEAIGYNFVEDDTTIVRLKDAEILNDSTGAVSIIKEASAEADLLATIPTRYFPSIDSTRFENFDTSGIRDNGFVKRIHFMPKCEDASNFRLNYKLPFSNNFLAIVVTYRCGEHELFTTLVTINKANKIIDTLDIAYDEVAESAFSKTSKIERDKIVITSSNWMSEEPIFETETYIIQNDGKFREVPSH
ncbi:carboxypeptidase-like regulatory domain-containing protein [Sphingobacterium thalpophilum]|uniref:carboxypeptidase-like regulatory domain-containing protein n=1 Tax=Sphingobacterium TaxID=28453 RepID=UPI002243100F|nr:MULTISPECIES: carboxypeptidase-like regulatory domain-containing protein [Sphingobacterium]MCW8313754.1 carboxypeptidase-like regulatory domain-containing protein [Sphingobacterium sp. InxBP1]